MEGSKSQSYLPAILVGIFILFCLGVVIFFYNQNQTLKNKIIEYQKQTPAATPAETIEPTAIATASATITACTLEARICPDGSSVGRSGPACEFAPCPTPN